LLRRREIFKTCHAAVAVQDATLAHEWRHHVPFGRQIVKGQFFMTWDGTRSDQGPGAEVDATVGGTGVVEIAPELAVWQQVRVGTNLNGVCIRDMGEGAGKWKYWRTWRQMLRGEHCLTMHTSP
jgi:hypothetical protein